MLSKPILLSYCVWPNQNQKTSQLVKLESSCFFFSEVVELKRNGDQASSGVRNNNQQWINRTRTASWLEMYSRQSQPSTYEAKA